MGWVKVSSIHHPWNHSFTTNSSLLVWPLPNSFTVWSLGFLTFRMKGLRPTQKGEYNVINNIRHNEPLTTHSESSCVSTLCTHYSSRTTGMDSGEWEKSQGDWGPGAQLTLLCCARRSISRAWNVRLSSWMSFWLPCTGAKLAASWDMAADCEPSISRCVGVVACGRGRLGRSGHFPLPAL